MPKKLRTIKPIPGIPVGTILEELQTRQNVFYPKSDWILKRGYYMKELSDFVEELKDPDEFWFTNEVASVLCSSVFPGISPSVPDYLRFKSKKSVEDFLAFMKDSHKKEIGDIYYYTNLGYKIVDLNATHALNDRV